MIESGKRELRIQESEDCIARYAHQTAVNRFARYLRKYSIVELDNDTIQDFWKTEFDGIEYRKREAADYLSRRGVYFTNAFPELLTENRELPEGWHGLWAAFTKDFGVKAQDAEEKQAREQKRKQAEAFREKMERDRAQFRRDKGAAPKSRSRWDEWLASLETMQEDAARAALVKPYGREVYEEAEKVRLQNLTAELEAEWERKEKRQDRDGDTEMGGV